MTMTPIVNWSPRQLPDLTGKIYFITGGNAGIGLEAAKMLAKAGADMVIGCRNPEKAKRAVAEIATAGVGKVSSVMLDLADLGSVRQAASEIRSSCSQLDGLINNAGIMQTPQMETRDGFELQLGTNHLGHFLLTGLLVDLVERAAGRIVVVSSIAHRYGKIHLADLMLTKDYTPIKAYTQSKLANLMFALELDRKLKARKSPAACIACHPGYSSTSLQSTGPRGLWQKVYKVLNPLMAQSADRGAIPTVLAVAGVEADPGAYYGPRGMGEMRGPVGLAKVESHAKDPGIAAELWRASEALVGLAWPAVA